MNYFEHLFHIKEVECPLYAIPWFFTGPASAGARKSGVGRFLCQVRNLYFFSVNQTVSENLFFKFTKKICL